MRARINGQAIDLAEPIDKAGLAPDAPLRTNGYADSSLWNNGNSGNASVPGTRTANITQSAVGDKRGLWTTVIASAILIFE